MGTVDGSSYVRPVVANLQEVIDGPDGLLLVWLPLGLTLVAAIRITSVWRGGAGRMACAVATMALILGVLFALVGVTGADLLDSLGDGERFFGFPFRHLAWALVVWSAATAVLLGFWLWSRPTSPAGRRWPRLTAVSTLAAAATGLVGGILMLRWIDVADRQLAGPMPAGGDMRDYLIAPIGRAMVLALLGSVLALGSAIALASPRALIPGHPAAGGRGVIGSCA